AITRDDCDAVADDLGDLVGHRVRRREARAPDQDRVVTGGARRQAITRTPRTDDLLPARTARQATQTGPRAPRRVPRSPPAPPPPGSGRERPASGRRPARSCNRGPAAALARGQLRTAARRTPERAHPRAPTTPWRPRPTTRRGGRSRPDRVGSRGR